MIRLPPTLRFATYPVSAFPALSGANQGHAIGIGAAAIPGDIYRLVRHARTAQLAIFDDPDRGQRVAPGSEVGNPGEAVAILECHNLMDRTGAIIDVLILRHTSGAGDATLHLLPLSPLRPGTEYELIASARATAPEAFNDIIPVGFFSGTRLTLASGALAPVETLRVGDLVLTRAHGPRPIRWIGQKTHRATGDAAPICITAGTLNAARDLRLSPHDRLFIWQRHDELRTGRSEVLIKAELLVNGTTVLCDQGGYLECYEILFDRREIVFAEGIAVESLRGVSETPARGPMAPALDGHAADMPADPSLEIDERALNDPRDAVERLARASGGIRV